ncbi:hypothetical protein GGQ99_005128 [Aminobacter niigataensis]|uniref:Uncharacterized protein n=1 Tax=Aminobacter niigataensis TaxID=83265 RepID=A0ABR6L9Q4_9HYPH|nr:hypothetical protein [Aminobacter niigataensis]
MTNVIQFPALSSRSFLARWPFLVIEEAQSLEPMPIRGRANDDGPSVEYCRRTRS